jgi:predicted RNase H-like nuclease (RuvC/YqgF family)
MPNVKETYEVALAEIKDIVEEKTTPAVAARLLKDINLYLVELRRDKAGLVDRNQELEKEVSVYRRELDRFRALPGELEVARARALNLERRNAALDANLRECADTIDCLKARQRECEAAVISGDSTFTFIKVKCLDCALHFSLCTWTPGRHGRDSLYCPECGQHAGRFLIWAEPGAGLIYQQVPGKAPLVAVG